MNNKTMSVLAGGTVASILASGLGGCAATGLTNEALEITKAEAAATLAHLSATEPEFAGLAGSSAGWAVFPGMFYSGFYFVGGGGGDGLVYTAGQSEPTGYSRQVRITLGLGSLGQYQDHVVFFSDEGAMNGFKEGGWEIGAEAGAGIAGLAASGEISFNNGYTIVADPRAGGGFAAQFTFDNYRYNDIAAAMGN